MEKLKEEIDGYIENFETKFKREYKKDKFLSLDSEDYFSEFKQLDKIWELKIVEPKKIEKRIEINLLDINDKIYKYYSQILEKYNYSTVDRNDLNSSICKIFTFLSNIYDLFPNFLEINFKNDWLNLHLKLIDTCLDINDPPKPSLGSNGKEKIDKLWPFLIFFSLCLSKDKDFNTRLFLILKHPDLFYKISIIAACNCYFCCCGHGMHHEDDEKFGAIKSILLVFETFKYMEEKKMNIDEAKKMKIKILEFLFENVGKNVSIVLLYQMGKMLDKDEIFNHLLNNTDLFEKAINKEKESDFSHAIDGFEAFVNLCKNPEYLFQILNIITPPNKGLKNNIYREILKTISTLITDNNQVEYLENKLYNNIIFQKVIDTLKLDTYLGDYEGIWQILLDMNNSNIVTIFYKNHGKYNIGDIMINQVNNLIKDQMTGLRLGAVVRIMNLFLNLGNEIKKKYNVENYYIEQFRDCYKKISGLDIKDDEDINEFKKYYESN